MYNTYSLHKIKHELDFPFEPIDYSKFKFGDDLISEKFGKALALGFINDVLNSMKIDKEVVVISSPYSHIPTATYALKNHFNNQINNWLYAQNLPSTSDVKIYRTVSYKEDYGAMDASQRMALIQNDSFYMDSLFVKNKILLFLDDIRITGSHEKMIKRMLANLKVDEQVWLLYFAELCNNNVNPNIENVLNYSFVKSLDDVDFIIKNSDFVFNTRVVKYILKSEKTEFYNFIDDKSSKFKSKLFYYALGNNYHSFDEYKGNMHYLREMIFVN